MLQIEGLSPQEVDQLVPPNTILLGYRGSIAHGMYLDPNRPNSVDDIDLMGVAIGPIDSYLGLETFEQKEVFYKEWDSVVYEVRKFVRLLCQANPNVLSLLWLKPEHYLHVTPAGQLLLDHRALFMTKRIFPAFTGYAQTQIKRMTHLAYEGFMGEKRKGLAQKFGYDTKNASHAIRLLRMGIEFLETGRLRVFRDDSRELLSIKQGEWTLEAVKAEADRLFAKAQTANDASTLPSEVDREKVNELLLRILIPHLSGTSPQV
jgi:predicted nucleotidyltransferase